MYNKKCVVCGEPFTSKRSDKETCKGACRQKLNRLKTAALMATVPVKKYIEVGKKFPKDYVIQALRGRHFPEPVYFKDYAAGNGTGYNTIDWCTRYTLPEAKEILEAEQKKHPNWTITIESFSELALKRLETIQPDSI